MVFDNFHDFFPLPVLALIWLASDNDFGFDFDICLWMFDIVTYNLNEHTSKLKWVRPGGTPPTDQVRSVATLAQVYILLCSAPASAVCPAHA